MLKDHDDLTNEEIESKRDLTNEEIESEDGRYVVAYNGWIMNTNLAFYNFVASESSVSKLNYYMHESM